WGCTMRWGIAVELAEAGFWQFESTSREKKIMNKRSHSTSRRTFIKAAGAAAFVAGAPMILRADDKPLEKNPIIGEGEYKYECIHGWAKVPEGMRFGNTHMVQEDAQGRIFIHHTGAPDSVFIFDPDGKFIKSWGKEWCGGAHDLMN